jgi:hypothetical protein
MTTSTRGRHRKLRRNILHTVIATALLAGTFTVVDQTANTPVASANEAGNIDGSFTPTTVAALSIAAFSDSSFVAGYATSPFVRRYDSSGLSQTLTTAYPASAIALEVDRSSNNFIAGGQAASSHRNQTFSQSGTLLSVAGSNNIIPKTSSAMKIANNAIYIGGDISSTWLQKFTPTLSADTNFNNNVNLSARQNASAIAVDSNGKIYYAGSGVGSTDRIKRANPNGTADSSFYPTTNPGSVTALEVDSSDNVYAGSSTAPYIYKFGNSGASDSTFASNIGSTFDGKINSIKIHNNMIYVGGLFTGGLKRLYLDGTPDAVFNANIATQLTNTVNDVEIDPVGRTWPSLSWNSSSLINFRSHSAHHRFPSRNCCGYCWRSTDCARRICCCDFA